MVSQGVQRKPSKEVYTSGARIKDHKRIKKDPSDPNIRVRGRNTLKQTVRLPSQTFMPAQFIGVCSNAKLHEIGENLLSMSDPISRPEERLIHAGALVRPPPL